MSPGGCRARSNPLHHVHGLADHAPEAHRAATAYQDLKIFWAWYAEEYGKPDLMLGIARPKVIQPDVPVLSRDQLGKILAASPGKDFASVRNRAILLVFMETGLRRTEVISLDLADVDLRARELAVRRGKGGRARVAVFGPETALALHRWMRKKGSRPGTAVYHRPGSPNQLCRDRGRAAQDRQGGGSAGASASPVPPRLDALLTGRRDAGARHHDHGGLDDISAARTLWRGAGVPAGEGRRHALPVAGLVRG